jgi:diguanylate cyclase (GGDEF)-like protein
MNDASLLDPLTGAFTRATFKEQLHIYIERAQREATTCSLLFFDLDHFKSINDAFGHARGDEALREVARCVKETTRESDLFFRYGGDEFVLILPDTPKSEAVQLATRLLDKIRTRPIGGDAALTLSISVGVASFPEDTAADDALFEKADARNYEAKRRGRARVIADEASVVSDLPFAELSRIIERDEALEVAQDFLSNVIQSQHGVLNIIGEQGSGRSRLLLEIEKRARLQGYEVIKLLGSPRSKSKPHGALAHAMEESSIELERYSLEEMDSALRRHLSVVGRDRLLFSVDDMPDLDWGTLDLLRQLLSNSSIHILRLICVSDPEYARVAVPFGSTVSGHVALQPLSMNGLRIWLRVLMQWEPPEDFIQWLEEQSHGLPQHVERILKYLLKQGVLLKQGSEWNLAENYVVAGADGMIQWQKRNVPNNLPAALTSFVGRESELAEIRRLLASARLLTVVGWGGMGKTRLTIQAAKESLNSFKDGVWLIELAPIADPSLALYTIASVLGVREEQSRPLLNTLTSWLSNKELLLVLDNCEHLIETCAQFSHGVLSASPNVRILASSREALDIAGELVYRMPALDIPNPLNHLPVGELTRFASARLFLERASFALSNFNLSETDAPLVAQICRQLDGIPLAIELAAARLKSMTLDEIAEGLNDRFNLLTRGNRGAMPRHQTLRALVDWSYDMLTEPERSLLGMLSVFSGGWTLEAAEQVCSQVGSANVSELLILLAGKSLINFDERASRYTMLETIRQYAQEKLTASNKTNGLQNLHLDFYVKFAEQAEPSLISAQRAEWVSRLESEHDNFRAALEQACGQNAELACRLVGALGWFWYFGDHLNEGYAWCMRVLSLNGNSVSIHSRARALNTAGIVSGNLGHNEESRSWLEQSAVLWRSLNEPRSFVETLFWLSYSLVQIGEDERVCQLYEENETVFRESADPLILGWALSYWARALENARGDFVAAKFLHDEGVALGFAHQDINVLGTVFMNLGYWSAKQEDYESGYQYHHESSKWHKADGAQLRIAISSHNMADMLSMQGKYLEAQSLYEESLSLSRALGDQAFIAWTAYRLGYVKVHLKEYERARDLFAESLKLYRAQNEQEYTTSCLAGFAELHRALGYLKRSARLLGFITAHPQSASRVFLLEIDSVEYDRSLNALRNQLSESDFNTTWDEGQRMTLTEALEQALAVRDV